MTTENFASLFRRATNGSKPFPYQTAFAEAAEIPEMVHAPTGAGKTATVVLGWLWRQLRAVPGTPRRLIYCLPMRVLVEQTRNEVERWLGNLGGEAQRIKVHVLMGGEEAEEWDLAPERPAIVLGTQDMLLSRALNRGYGMGRFRWPLHFASLNNDCLWVLDEIQLMGVGLATSTQLQAFRESLGTFGTVRTVWMSATLLPVWLASVDYRDRIMPQLKLRSLTLDPQADYEADGLRERRLARKPIFSAGIEATDTKKLAAFVREKHRAGSLTLVVTNTVERARALYEALEALSAPPTKKGKKGTAAEPTPDLKLIHSRFRPRERQEWWNWLTEGGESLRKGFPAGRIVVATQVVEAGVDLSARTLVTELAPWPSLVQRFGRCNRRGEFREDSPAQVFWIDLDAKKSAPYPQDELDASRECLGSLDDVGLRTLDEFFRKLDPNEKKWLFPYEPPHVVRRKDFLDLFDTTPDLAGNDIDVSRFIREGDDLDVQVFWRPGPPPDPAVSAEPGPQREELCSVSFMKFRKDFIEKGKTVHRWDALEGRWQRIGRADADSVYPGQVYRIAADQGGYRADLGWDPATATVECPLGPFESEPASLPEAPYDGDPDAARRNGSHTIAEHTCDVVGEVRTIAAGLPLPDEFRPVLELAARLHDWGKAHDVFQKAVPEPADLLPGTLLAKAAGHWKRYERKHFRHELASALAALALGETDKLGPVWRGLGPEMRNLVLYLIASHHGKVRLSIRSMPGEPPPPGSPAPLFARGLRQGDELPAVDLGGGTVLPAVRLDLSPMRLGRSDGRPSWVERMLELRDHAEFGPLRLAYLEAVLRAADIRASRAAERTAKGGER